MGINTCCNQNHLSRKDIDIQSFVKDNQSTACKLSLDKYFPGAKTGKECDVLVGTCLEARGFTGENTLYTDSSCPDEINHDSPNEDITSIFQNRWGEIFPLGGLAGFPFTGKTGWHAFSSHCPKDGNIVILFAPHVGVNNQGEVGKVVRDGQDFASSACGAAIGALAATKADPTCADFQNGYLDHQMDCIKHLLAPHSQKIAMAENEQTALVYKMYDILEKYIEDIIHLKWMSPKSQLAIFGGIMINCDEEGTDRFLPLKFEVRTQTASEDLFD